MVPLEIIFRNEVVCETLLEETSLQTINYRGTEGNHSFKK
jgi:hypothetical protein